MDTPTLLPSRCLLNNQQVVGSPPPSLRALPFHQTMGCQSRPVLEEYSLLRAHQCQRRACICVYLCMSVCVSPWMHSWAARADGVWVNPACRECATAKDGFLSVSVPAYLHVCMCRYLCSECSRFVSGESVQALVASAKKRERSTERVDPLRSYLSIFASVYHHSCKLILSRK